MDETVTNTVSTPPATQPTQSNPAQQANTSTTQTYVDESGKTMTVTTEPGANIGNLAEVVQRTGPDPVMLASVLIFGSMMLTLVMYLVRRFQGQQERMIEHQQSRSEADQSRFQEQLHRQRDEFRNELSSQRVAHLSELDRNSHMFERSLERIVSTNKEGMESLSARLSMMDDRLVRVEAIVVSHFDVKNRRRSDEEMPKEGTVRVTQEIRGKTQVALPLESEVPAPQPAQLYQPAFASSSMSSVQVVSTQNQKSKENE